MNAMIAEYINNYPKNDHSVEQIIHWSTKMKIQVHNKSLKNEKSKWMMDHFQIIKKE